MTENNVTTIIYKDEVLYLSAMRAVFWPSQKILIIADMHLGKTAHFRKHGIQIPSSVLQHDLQRLSTLIEIFQPKQVLIVGDMFHHTYNNDILQFQQWRNMNKNIAFTLVPGNHDRHMQLNYNGLDIEITENVFEQSPFTFIHEWKEMNSESFLITGHIHPGVVIQGCAKQRMLLPCFVYNSNHLILPAFSNFTGLYTGYEKKEKQNYFAISNDKIYKL